MTHPQLEEILSELRERLQQLYGDRLDKLILYGSQARGDAEPDSDIDVLVVLKGEVNPFQEIEKAGDITADVGAEFGVLVSCLYVSSVHFGRSDRSLIKNVQREGIRI